jgi:hypothetical protein
MFFTYERSRAAIRRQVDDMLAMPAKVGDALFVQRPGVSGWSAGEHLDHLAKVTGSVLRQLSKNEAVDVPPISVIGRVILTTGWIPRGKARSPEKLRAVVTTREELEKAFAELAAMIGAFPGETDLLSGRPLMKHPIFRGLDATQSLRFIEIHNAHHLKIARDVLRPR